MTRHSFWGVRIISLMCIFTLILLFESGAAIWQTQHSIRTESQQRVSAAIKQFDSIFNSSQDAVRNALPMLKDSCDEDTSTKLNNILAGSAGIRNVLFTYNGEVFCTARHGRIQGAHFTAQDNNFIYIRKQSFFEPYRPIMLYRFVQGNYAVIATFELNYIRNTLSLFESKYPLSLHATGYKTSSQKSLDADTGPLKSTNGHYIRKSLNYNYWISIAIPPLPSWVDIWNYSKGFLFAFLIIDIFISIIFLKILRNAHTLLSEMKVAIHCKEFMPYLQPQINSKDHSLAGCEALIRWIHPSKGIILPNDFVPQAESSGLIVDMTNQLIREVTDTFAPIAKNLPDNFQFSFNICAKYCQHPSLFIEIMHFIRAFAGTSVKLVLEITERDPLLLDDCTRGILKKFRQLGILISLDDFGTGYSGLSYLHSMHVDILKIDRRFISTLQPGDPSEYIISSIVDCSRKLNILIVAEGVESQEQIKKLEKYDIDYLQGFYFGKPVTQEQFIARWFSDTYKSS